MSAVWTDHLQPLLRQLGEWIKRAVVWTARESKSVVGYYWRHREDLWKLFAEKAPFFQEHGARKVLRVAEDDNLKSIFHDGNRWQAELPDCCAVCGEPTAEAWIEEERMLPRLAWPLWTPVWGLGVGFFAFLLGYGWLLPILVWAGFWIGYRRRTELAANVRFRRCDDDARRTDLPGFRIDGQRLIIDVGHRAVFRKFREAEFGIEPVAVPESPSTVVEGAELVPTTQRNAGLRTPIPLAGDDEADHDDASDDQLDLAADAAETDMEAASSPDDERSDDGDGGTYSLRRDPR